MRNTLLLVTAVLAASPALGNELNPLRSSSVRKRRSVTVLVVVGMVGLVAAGSFVADRMLYPVSFVDRITVVNPTPYDLEVDVTGAVERGQAKTVEDVIDQGREWIFRFRSGGYDGGEARVTREQLRRDDWRFTVPAEVAQRLQMAGLVPSPIRQP